MSISKIQTEIRDQLLAAVATAPSRQVIYCSEWLGYLPFGVYHWMEHDGEPISPNFPSEWQRSDLDALEQAGLLTKTTERQDPDDAYDVRITYEVSL